MSLKIKAWSVSVYNRVLVSQYDLDIPVIILTLPIHNSILDLGE